MSNAFFSLSRLALAGQTKHPDRTASLTGNNGSGKVGSVGNHQNFENGYPIQMASEISAGRPPYDKAKFEARAEVLAVVRRHLESAAKQELTRPLIEIVGVTWIGKTWLLKHVEENYKRGSNQHVGKRSTFTLYFDLEDVTLLEPSEAEIFQWFTRFLRAFIPTLERASGTTRPNELEILRQKESGLPLDPVELQQALISLKSWFVELRRKYFPILVLDSLEKIDASLLAWLEYEILVPFVKDNQALIITAGRHPVKWREPEIRFYSDFIRLGALEEWGTLGDQGVPKWIHERYALGHAGLAAKLYELLQPQRDRIKQVDAFDGTAIQQGIVESYLKEGIEKIVLNDVPGEDKPGKQMNLRGILWTISVLRIFGPETLKMMVDTFGPAEYHDKSYMFFRQVGFNLVGNHIAAWRAGLSDYRVEPLVRRIMANALQILDGAGEFSRRHETAEQGYRDALWDAPSTAPFKLPELLYHYCARMKLLEPDELSEKAIVETNALVEALALAESKSELDTLVQRLKNQDDADLKELRCDMIKIVGTETYQAIVNVFQQALTASEPVPAM